MIAKIIPRGASRDDRAGALIGYIERDGRDGAERDGRDGAERVDACLDDAGNLIAYVSRDARVGAVIDVERVMADRKYFLSRVPDVDAETGEVMMREYPVETQRVLALDTAAKEFRAVAAESRATNPYLHLVLSWRDGEHPTNAQAFEAGHDALGALGLGEHQYVMAVHRGETGNDHLHVAVNRVHPETHRAQHLSKSYYALDRAMREIELRQGWERDNGPYEVRDREDGLPEIVRASGEERGRGDEAPANVKTRARDGQAWTGDQPFTAWVREVAPALRDALDRDNVTWSDVRTVLAQFNLELREKGSGFVVVDRTDERLVAKASHIGRFASRERLEQRLGPFEREGGETRRIDDPRRLEYNRSAGHRHNDAHRDRDEHRRESRDDRTTGSNRGEPHSEREYWRDPEKRAQRREERGEARERLYAEFRAARDGRDRYAEAWAQQRTSERERSAEITDQKHRDREELRKTMPPRVAASLASLAAAQRREQLRDDIARERHELGERLGEERAVSWREFVTERARGGDEAAESALRGLRYQEGRDRRRAERDADTMTGPDLAGRPAQTRLRGLQFRVRVDGAVAYYDGNDALRREVIRDQGFRIVVRQQSGETIAAALRLAAERWGGDITINGSAAFKERALKVAVDLGIRARNGELQDRQRELMDRRPVAGDEMRHRNLRGR
ncbi:MAG: relaxase/mobilization nuclease domain-containing protein [Candidatus Eremiobacteraeota bacterium]|nr:relaxase/mobilization nuclease domain-containing protein [Candidatus Eremiobacteraeota bacterium]MBC5805924.1 relaxase/mobilization nuclease domain-containing protein [Candidatus Eremiobacteraeota bacterium]MBC5823455.1 relaxase/mobilization nuclease domain-containing protein [Candidatus Eremiobacteraeota bacterium]